MTARTSAALLALVLAAAPAAAQPTPADTLAVANTVSVADTLAGPAASPATAAKTDERVGVRAESTFAALDTVGVAPDTMEAALDARDTAVARLDAGGAAPDTSNAEAKGEAPPKRVAVAVEQVLLANVVVNLGARAFGGELQRDMEFSFETWARNLRLGWEWDEEGFVVNMFGHPYQGALYFNAGRHNGLSYWESVPLVVLGSWTWEYLGESLRPSLNDFFTTTLSGVAFGEMSYRLSRAIRDETATGRERWLRELGAAVVNPVGAANRVLRGDAWRVGENDADRLPRTFLVTVDAGARLLYRRGVSDPDLTPTLAFDVAYGDALNRSFDAPFDVFSARGQASASGTVLEFLQTSGRLWQRDLVTDGPLRLAVQGSQRFDYTHTPAYSFGGQSLEGGLIGRYALRPGLDLHARAGASGFPLSGVTAPPVASVPGQPTPARTYDFGPGIGVLVEASVRWKGMPVLLARSQYERLYTVSGTPAQHGLLFGELRGVLPLRRGFGAGVHVSRDRRRSEYDAAAPLEQATAQVFAFVTWTNARRRADR